MHVNINCRQQNKKIKTLVKLEDCSLDSTAENFLKIIKDTGILSSQKLIDNFVGLGRDGDRTEGLLEKKLR